MNYPQNPLNQRRNAPNQVPANSLDAPGQPQQPQSHNPLDDIPSGKRLSLLDMTCGWVLSLVVHLILLAIFGTATLLTSDSSGVNQQEGEAVEVIFDNSQQESIESVQDTSIEINQDNTNTSDLSSLAEAVGDPQTTKQIKSQQTTFEGSTKIHQLSPMSSDSNGLANKSVRNANWGNYGASGKGNSGGFFQMKSTGSKVVYIIDLSGSMAQDNRIVEARDELIRSIQALNRNSKFYIMFYNDKVIKMRIKDKKGVWIDEQLVRADSRNKRQAIDWIRKVTSNPNGHTKPEAAIDIAFTKLKPDQIFFLSDGEFSAKVVDDVQKLYSMRPIKVSTVAYFSTDGQANLKAISDATGGANVIITKDMLRGRP